MTPSRHQLSVALFLLALTFANAALLVHRPDQGPRTSQMLARRAVRRSRRFSFVRTSRAQVYGAKAEAADQPGATAGTDYDLGLAWAVGAISLAAAPAQAMIGAAEVPAVRCPDVPLYYLFCALLV
jgi:hypothetical protein